MCCTLSWRHTVPGRSWCLSFGCCHGDVQYLVGVGVCVSHCLGHAHYLVRVGPEGADGELGLDPALGDGGRGVPHGVPLRAAVDLDVDIERAGAGSVAAGQ